MARFDTHDHSRQPVLIRLPQVLHLTGISVSEVYRRMSAGTFPRPVKLGDRAVAWPRDEIVAWVEKLMNDRSSKTKSGTVTS